MLTTHAQRSSDALVADTNLSGYLHSEETAHALDVVRLGVAVEPAEQ